MKIELVIDKDCPNVEDARKLLSNVLNNLNLPLDWYEWDRASDLAPAYVKKHGSPTFLINGKDVYKNISDENCCRLYPNKKGGLKGIPEYELLKISILEELNNEH